MTDRALPGAVTAAVATVCDIEPQVLRADTPLADIGADDVAMMAIFMLLGAVPRDAAQAPPADVVAAGAAATTVGDLAALVDMLESGR